MEWLPYYMVAGKAVDHAATMSHGADTHMLYLTKHDELFTASNHISWAWAMYTCVYTDIQPCYAYMYNMTAWIYTTTTTQHAGVKLYKYYPLLSFMLYTYYYLFFVKGKALKM